MFSGIPQPYVIDIYVFYFEGYMPGYLGKVLILLFFLHETTYQKTFKYHSD